MPTSRVPCLLHASDIQRLRTVIFQENRIQQQHAKFYEPQSVRCVADTSGLDLVLLSQLSGSLAQQGRMPRTYLFASELPQGYAEAMKALGSSALVLSKN